jgi:hypothetical protein
MILLPAHIGDDISWDDEIGFGLGFGFDGFRILCEYLVFVLLVIVGEDVCDMVPSDDRVNPSLIGGKERAGHAGDQLLLGRKRIALVCQDRTKMQHLSGRRSPLRLLKI